ncbi:tetratricopeptide repeat protein [Flavobacteriaceae bacterium MAR_2010_105]|nr:tetratricopeptide repeat protein [Flavobacteriaceae bacterium MAR_2010_105]
MWFRTTLFVLLFVFGASAMAQIVKASSYQDSLGIFIRKSATNPELVIKQSDSLLALAKEKNDTKLYASFTLSKGTAFSFLGKNKEALEHQMEAYKLFDSINDLTGKAIALLNISFSQIHLHNYQKAKDYLLQTLAMTDKENRKLLISIYANLGTVSTELGQYNEGIDYYEKALINYQKSDNPDAMALMYHGIAIAHHKLNNQDLAESYYIKGLDYQRNGNSDYVLSGLALSLGELYLDQNQLVLSKKYLDIGGKAAYEFNSPYYLEIYYKHLVNWYKAKGNYRAALEQHEKLTTLRDSFYSLEIVKSNNEIEEKFQSELKTSEIQLLKTQKDLATAQVEKNKFWALILILVTILCFAGIVVLYQNYKGNKKSNELLRLEKIQLAERNQLLEGENVLVQFETLKTQVSPHFLFNSLNALTSLIKTDKEKALKFTKEFSKIFRSTLELKAKNIITLKEELDHVNSYLYLQRMRFDSNLNIKINIDSDFLNHYLPPFSLQMVIENAIKHNTITSESPLHIKIKATQDFLIVTNNLQPRQVTEDSTKTGVKNIISRYQYISELEPSFEIKNNLFYVKLPLIKE